MQDSRVVYSVNLGYFSINFRFHVADRLSDEHKSDRGLPMDRHEGGSLPRVLVFPLILHI